ATGDLVLLAVTGTGADRVFIQSTAANVSTNVSTGAGDDGIMIGSTADFTGVIDGILGTIAVNLGGGVNGLVVNDTGGTTTDGVVVFKDHLQVGKFTQSFLLSYAATGGSLYLNVATGSGGD